jgi:predicted aspartyl protease
MQGSGFKIFSGLMMLAIASLVMSAPSQATTRRVFYEMESDTCYLVTSSGQRLPLGQLCGDQPPSTLIQKPNAQSKVIRVKIKRRISSTPVIEVMFNRDRAFEMIVDTGASASLITQPMATALGIQPTRTIQAGIANGETVHFPVGQVRSMSVGNLSVNNVEVAIAGQMDVGLLGHDFFGNYDIKIKRDVVEFYPR